ADKAAAAQARTAYEALTATQKAIVGDITRLTEAEAVIAGLETLTSKVLTTFDFSTVYAAQARGESKTITSTNFQANPKHFTISDGKITIPVDLTWNIPLNGFTTGQVVGSAVDSFIQDYCNAHGIDLGNRTLGGMGFEDTFFITTFKTGSSASITLGGNDWSFFFQNNHYTGTDEDSSKNRTFTIGDGAATATIMLDWNYADMAALVSDLNNQLNAASVAAIAVKVNENQFKLVPSSSDKTITVSGRDKDVLFGN
ncbi:hypothetical protein, partial [Paenibacillus humicus]